MCGCPTRQKLIRPQLWEVCLVQSQFGASSKECHTSSEAWWWRRYCSCFSSAGTWALLQAQGKINSSKYQDILTQSLLSCVRKSWKRRGISHSSTTMAQSTHQNQPRHGFRNGKSKSWNEPRPQSQQEIYEMTQREPYTGGPLAISAWTWSFFAKKNGIKFKTLLKTCNFVRVGKSAAYPQWYEAEFQFVINSTLSAHVDIQILMTLFIPSIKALSMMRNIVFISEVQSWMNSSCYKKQRRCNKA